MEVAQFLIRWLCGLASKEHYSFESVYELEKIAEDDVQEVHDGRILGKDTDGEIKDWPYRRALFTEDGRMAGDVSKNFYNIFQYPDILDTTAQALRNRQQDTDFEVRGNVEISETYHKMSSKIHFDGETDIVVGEDDVIKNGLRVRSGHSGMHGLKVEQGGLREVCSNGMMAWMADHTYEQTHSESFQPELVQKGVDAVIDGRHRVEERLERAEERKLRSTDEVRLLLHDLDLEYYLDTPVADIPLSIEEEVTGERPSLKDAYDSATRALTHHAREDIPQYKLDEGYERAAQLLETGVGLPHEDELVESTLESRAYALTESDGEEYWEGETEDVREMMEGRGLTAGGGR